jgi:hypothetical protein
MTDREFKKLSRGELIEILYELEKQKEEKDAELARKDAQIESLQKKLDEKVLHVLDAGNIAEASLKLSGVFEAAQAAADQYLLSIKSAQEDQVRKKEEIEAQKQVILDEAKRKADLEIGTAKAQAQQILQDAQTQADEKWNQFEKRASDLIAAHEELRMLIGR